MRSRGKRDERSVRKTLKLPNEPNPAGIRQPIAPNEPAAGPETAPNEANPVGSGMPTLTKWNIRVSAVAFDLA
jgi:hypothetical protein